MRLMVPVPERVPALKLYLGKTRGVAVVDVDDPLSTRP